jgi:hypothetical protein
MVLELVRPCPARILDAQPCQAVPTTSELLDAHMHGSPRHRSEASAERRLEEQLAVETSGCSCRGYRDRCSRRREPRSSARVQCGRGHTAHAARTSPGLQSWACSRWQERASRHS